MTDKIKDKPEPTAEEIDAHERKMLEIAVQALRPFPEIMLESYERRDGIRQILKAIDAVWEYSNYSDLRKKYPEWYGGDYELHHIVATAVSCLGMPGDLSGVSPYSLVGAQMMAFAGALLVTEAASDLENALDGEYYSDHCASVALSIASDKP